MSPRSTDLTTLPDLSHAHPMRPVGPRWPVYEDAMPPCNAACPAGENIQGWLALAQAGDFDAAFHVLTVDNPLPAVHGRVCYHPCESSCNRTELDSAVGIHAVERFLGDHAIIAGLRFEPGPSTQKRVLVVGAGPSGLSAAYHLRKLGHEVEVHDAGPVAGGMMVSGIPEFRLPRALLAAEVARIEAMGVRFELRHQVIELERERDEGHFDAVFLAVGAHISKQIDIPTRDASRVLDAVSLLDDVAKGARPKLGRRVAIYGGGNTAMDAARVALRLGSEPLVIYRRDRKHMPAHKEEAVEALAEGIQIQWLRSIKAIEDTSYEVEIMELDERGKPHGTGRFEKLEADSLVLALGQDVDTAFLNHVDGIKPGPDGVVHVGPDLQTGHHGIFAGGDMVASARTVTIAVGHGKKAARSIDTFLRGATATPRHRPEVVRFGELKLWYSTVADRTKEPHTQASERTASFDEVVHSLSEREARYEAKRCFSCGNCFECDACLGACPSDAVIKLGKGNRYRFDYDRCTSCAVCFEQCPAHAIRLVATRPDRVGA